MNTLFIGMPLFIGSLIGVGYLIKVFINIVSKGIENYKFGTLLLTWTSITFASVFLVLFTFWFLTDVTSFLDDAIHYTQTSDFNILIKLKISLICSLIFAMSFTIYKLYKMCCEKISSGSIGIHDKKIKKIIIPYMTLMLLISLCICFCITILTHIYVLNPTLPILYGMLLFGLLSFSYVWYSSTTRKNIILKRKIKKINSKIQTAIDLIKIYIDDPSANYKKYNSMRKKVNKILSKRNINQTFQPVFLEDETVVNIIYLFEKVSSKTLSLAYKQYKELFKKQNGLKPLDKLHKDTPIHLCVTTAKNYMILLQGTIDNNNLEIEGLSTSRQYDKLYQKYNIFQTVAINKKLIL